MMIERIREGIEERLCSEQSAYGERHSTTEQLFILRSILEQSIE